MNIEHIAEQLHQAANFALSKQYKIVDDCWGSVTNEKCCCLIGALLIKEIGELPICANLVELLFDKAIYVFGSLPGIWAFIAGFEGNPRNHCNMDSEFDSLFLLGQNLRSKYKPIKHFNIMTGEANL